MRASLDTNVIIHLYRANLQKILFEFFNEGVFVYEQIRSIELNNHGKDVISAVDRDIAAGKIEVFSDSKLKELGVYTMFQNNVKENRLLYGPGDLGEVYAISLAQTMGAYSLVTDDTKQGGPYMSLLQLDYDVTPYNFVDVLILRYLSGTVDECQTVADFNAINSASNLNWSLKSQLAKFIKRFISEPYKEEEKQRFEQWTEENGIDAVAKFKSLRKLIV